jgi:hypothetical protein
MCACKETDVRGSPNDCTPAGGEGQGSRGETFHPICGESPVSSVAEHPLCVMLNYLAACLLDLRGLRQMQLAWSNNLYHL